MKKNSSKTKYWIIIMFLVFICVLLFFFLINCLKKIEEENKKYIESAKVLDNKSKIDGISVINNIYIYSMYLNVSGTIPYVADINSMELVLYDNKDVKSYPLMYEEKNNKIMYNLSSHINEGINLDEINIGKYMLLLKIKINNEYKYYSLYNTTSYSYMDYYTITRNGYNNYVEVSSNNSNININVDRRQLPDDIYDIVIDPGHGGDDSGAVKNGVYESVINLEVAMKLKSKLESLGLKVKLTREGNYNPGNLPGITAYGEHGRINIGYETKAKFFISIHSNSYDLYPASSGIEVYTSSHNNKKLAKLIADNIVSSTGIIYSKKLQDKVDNGVYVRNISSYELESYKKDARKQGYTFYESVNSSTQYYYVIRETGGIVTNAYVDGRNKNKELNIYRNSNIGMDGYLIELGYMTNSNDLKILLDKKDGYATGISDALKKYLNITN